MIIYSVTIVLEPEIESDWVDWMSRVHVPDVLRTGCFIQSRMFRVVDAADSPTYVLHYHCRSLEDYQRYKDTFAAILQSQHTERYAGRFRASRQILEDVS